MQGKSADLDYFERKINGSNCCRTTGENGNIWDDKCRSARQLCQGHDGPSLRNVLCCCFFGDPSCFDYYASLPFRAALS